MITARYPFSRDVFRIILDRLPSVDALIDMARTLDNMIGSGVATVVVAAWNTISTTTPRRGVNRAD